MPAARHGYAEANYTSPRDKAQMAADSDIVTSRGACGKRIKQVAKELLDDREQVGETDGFVADQTPGAAEQIAPPR